MINELSLEEKYNILKLENKELHIEIDSMNMLFDKYVITSVTDTKGIIQSVSQPFEQISGYTKEELIGRPHSILRHQDMEKSVFKELWSTISNKKIWHGEIKNRKKDGGYYWVDSIIIPLLNNDREITGYRAIRIDITDTKKIDNYSDFLIDDDEDFSKYNL